MTGEDTQPPIRELPPSGKHRVANATRKFLEATPSSFLLGATIGGLVMATAVMTLLPPLGVLGAAAWIGASAVAGGIFTTSVLAGIKAERSWRNDTFNQLERDAVFKERPVPLEPIIDPDLPSVKLDVKDKNFFQRKLQSQHETPLAGVQR